MNILKIILLIITPSIVSAYQGFGADTQFTFNKTIPITSLSTLLTELTSSSKLVFPSYLSFSLSQPLILSNLSNIILMGPAQFLFHGIQIINCSNIILSNLRILNASIYGILIYNSSNVILDRLTILDAGRDSVEKGKCVDITEGSFNVTVQGSLMGFTGQVQDLVKNKGMLIANFKYGPVGNVSLHHNLFYCDYQRSPEISTPGLFDMVNNVVFNYTEYGSRIRNGAYGNFNSNAYIGGKKDPLVFVDQNPKVYSVYNTWKYACVNWTYIDDLVTHQRFDAPTVKYDKFADARKIVGQSGCTDQSHWQTMIKTNVFRYVD